MNIIVTLPLSTAWPAHAHIKILAVRWMPFSMWRSVVELTRLLSCSRMCAAIDMLASEHFYGHSPPAGFLTDYSLPTPRRPIKLTTRGFSAPCLVPLKPVQLTLKSAPRSCIKLSTDKKNKRVVFADDRGFALEQVKFMTEPSHVPPYWAMKIISSPPQERKPPPKPVADLWETRFVQPASDYVEFRRRITEDCVSLENVILKQNECAVDGTVKVKNLDFSKEVGVRVSFDGWTTSEDTSCAFVESGPLNANGVSLYDTFAFRLQLPIHSRRLDFCVYFKCKGSEYWDNNKGLNYTIEKASVRSSPGISCARINYGNSWTRRSDGNGNVPYWWFIIVNTWKPWGLCVVPYVNGMVPKVLRTGSNKLIKRRYVLLCKM